MTAVAVRSAEISKCGQYRYNLIRGWDPDLPPMAFVGLNPSTADGRADDPTIRRCVQFAKDWGYGSLTMVNLYAYRATDPRAVLACATEDEAYGPANTLYLRETARITRARGGIVVPCWGASKLATHWCGRIGYTLGLLSDPVHVLGLTKDGAPRHPLYVPASTAPVEWFTEEALAA